jgi:tetratricopeptide (TPR) repeat protein
MPAEFSYYTRSSGAGEINAATSLGIAYSFIGQYDKAIDYYFQSLLIAQHIKDKHGEHTALANLAAVYYSLKSYAKAIDYYKQCLVIVQKIQYRQVEGSTLGNLGLI